MAIPDERTTPLLDELRQTLVEIDRLADQARKLMDKIEGKEDAKIEARVAAALAALRAKARARKASGER